jgi:hypothetical protein
MCLCCDNDHGLFPDLTAKPVVTTLKLLRVYNEVYYLTVHFDRTIRNTSLLKT